jgi:hypothetical protein
MEFGTKLKEAYDSGVTVKIYSCSISLDEIKILREIPLIF